MSNDITSSNLDRTRAIYEAFNDGRPEAFIEAFAEDAVMVVPGTRSHIPWAGTWHGRQGVAECLAALDEATDVEALTPERFVADGDHVSVFGHEKWRARATGELVSGSFVQTFTFRDGQVVRFDEHFDTDTAAVALCG